MVLESETILLAHGGGGRLMQALIEEEIFPAFANPLLAERHDGATLSVGAGRIAFTTDSYVVRPHVFPGGDIGSLAVFGTVNDLAMCGARPAVLSAAFILEEGFPRASFRAVLGSMRAAAARAGVTIVTGDTKVVDKGKGDGIFVNTAGIGVVEHRLKIGPASVRPGDDVILSGDLGRHGVAILAAREGLEMETTLVSDSAPLHEPVLALLEAGVEVRCLRDLTRGGLGAALVEIASSSALPITIEEERIPVGGEVRAACEILGLDPVFVANEGRFVAFVPPGATKTALSVLASRGCPGATWIGSVAGEARGRVTLRTAVGTLRLVDPPSGEQLPRIC
jgi:hydrogenase expression/formation protein HypE